MIPLWIRMMTLQKLFSIPAMPSSGTLSASCPESRPALRHLNSSPCFTAPEEGHGKSIHCNKPSLFPSLQSRGIVLAISCSYIAITSSAIFSFSRPEKLVSILFPSKKKYVTIYGKIHFHPHFDIFQLGIYNLISDSFHIKRKESFVCPLITLSLI